ncbi:MAG TPA: zinc ribbon domain-containing protein [Myxococcota bacterium]
MQLIACSNCHTQYDVSQVIAESFPCRCGETLENKPLKAVDARIHRCGSCGAQIGAEVKLCDYCGSEIVRDPAKLSLICPECYARNADAARFCTACGVAFRPEPVRVEGHELPCPACGALMPASQVAGIGLNECRECNGLWVPGKNFDVLVSRATEARRAAASGEAAAPQPRVQGANPAEQRVQYRKCPECDVYMQRRNYRKSSGIIIDVCRTHGTWLDADELERIAGFILSGGRESPTLQAEHEHSSAEAAAAAAFARVRAQHETDAMRRSLRRDDDLAGGLLGILTRILS